MRVLGAIVISLSGAIASFIGVLAALDGAEPAPRPTADAGRTAAFAQPGLADAVASARPDARRNAATIAASGRAWVAPIARRKPIEPPAPAAVAEARPVAVPKPVVAAKPQPAQRVARAKRAVDPQFDVTTRSALGGPRLPAEAR